MNLKSASLKIGPWFVDPAAGEITNGSRTLTLRPREMDLLVCLARHGGEVVTIDEIIADAWHGAAVTNDSLYFAVGQLRKALDAEDSEASIIETIPKRGYRLVAPVTVPVHEPPVYGGNRVTRHLAWLGVAVAVLVAVLTVAGRVGIPGSGQASQVIGNSIAVMPFIDLSPDTDYTYFSDGISEELLNRLTRVPGLQVAARTSSFAFKGDVADIVEIGKALGVASVLEGSVRKEGDRVRISAQLIDARTGFQLWSETYDQELGSMFEIQNAISHRIVDALEIELGDPAVASSVQQTAPEAVEYYLMGLEAQRGYSFESLTSALRHFERALAIDPGFNQARTGLAEAKLRLLSIGASFDKSLLDDAESLAKAALAAGATGSDAYRILGNVNQWRGKFEEAAHWLTLALDAAPSDAGALVLYADVKHRLGDTGEARALLERAVRIDPFGTEVLMKYGRVQWYDGLIDGARATFERGSSLHPANPSFPWLLGLMQVTDLGELAGGLQNFLRAAELDPRDFEIDAYIAATYLTLDMPGAARPWVDRALERGPRVATSLAAESIWLALTGNEQRAGRLAAAVVNGGSYHFRGHRLLNESLYVLAGTAFVREGEPQAALALLQTAAARAQGVDASEALVARDKVPLPRILLSLAGAYKAAGQPEQAIRTLQSIEEAGTGGHHGPPWDGSKTLFEAEARIVEGDRDAALDLLEQVASEGPLFNWQVQIASNHAFDELRDDPRYNDALARIEESAALQRQRLPGKVLLSRSVRIENAAAPR